MLSTQVGQAALPCDFHHSRRRSVRKGLLM